MLIEEFIRVGRALLESDPRPERLLRLVTDVADDTVKNFYRNVFVAYVPEGAGEVRVQARQEFGQEGEKKKFSVNVPQALGAPISLPAGGNPLQAQGRYGLPAYPCYDPTCGRFRGRSRGRATSSTAGCPAPLPSN